MWLSNRGGGGCWAPLFSITRCGKGKFANEVGLERDLACFGVLLSFLVVRISAEEAHGMMGKGSPKVKSTCKQIVVVNGGKRFGI